MPKRRYTPTFQSARAGTSVRRKFVQPRRFVKGRDRVGGYYGRYKQTSSGELKFHDVDVTDAVIAQGCQVFSAGTINIIPQGVTEKQRVGRKCTVKSINWRYNVNLPGTATNGETSDTIRIMLYQDKQCNGATITNTDLLESNNFQSFNNLANSSRFRVLMDKTHEIHSPSGSGRGSTDTLSFGEMSFNGTLFKKCNIPLEFDAATGALTELRSNNLNVMVCSASGFVGFTSKIRLRFTDN